MNLELPHTKKQHQLTLCFAALIVIGAIAGLVFWLPLKAWPHSLIQLTIVPPHAAILFLMLATGLGCATFQRIRLANMIGRVIVACGSAIVMLTTLSYHFDITLTLSNYEFMKSVYESAPVATGFSFILAGLILATYNKYPAIFINRFDSLITAFILLPLLSLFSFIFNPTAISFSHNLITMPALFGLNFIFFFFGIILQIEGKGAAGLLTRNTHSAKNFRALAFFVLFIPLCFGSIITHAVEHQLLNAGFAAAAFCLFTTILITISLAHNAILQEHWFKQLKRERKRSNLLQNQIHELLDISLDGIILFDDKSQILHANSGATKLLGWSQEQLQSMTVKALMSEKNIDEYDHFIKRFTQQDRQESYEIPGTIYALTKEGHELPLTVTLSKKSADEQTLIVAILKSMEDINQQLHFLEQKAKFDPVTQTLNRSEFEEYCQSLEKSPSRRSDKTICTIVLDLDNFKNVNDKFGHDIGDNALAACADAIHGTLRDSDKLFRIGGEEFVVLAQNLSQDDALIFSDRIRIAVKSTPIKTPTQNIFISCSLGVCMVDLKQTTMKNAMKLADDAMYQAKEQGKDQIVFAGINVSELTGS